MAATVQPQFTEDWKVYVTDELHDNRIQHDQIQVGLNRGLKELSNHLARMEGKVATTNALFAATVIGALLLRVLERLGVL